MVELLLLIIQEWRNIISDVTHIKLYLCLYQQSSRDLQFFLFSLYILSLFTARSPNHDTILETSNLCSRVYTSSKGDILVNQLRRNGGITFKAGEKQIIWRSKQYNNVELRISHLIKLNQCQEL